MSRKFAEVPFTNEAGEVINPGDVVVFAATSWKTTTLRKGVYEGCTIDEKGAVSTVRVKYQKNKTRWVQDGTRWVSRGMGMVDCRSALQLKRIYKSADSFVGEQFGG